MWTLKTTRQQWTESLQVIIKALTEDPVEFHGELWNIDGPVTLVPATYQRPHPPIFVSAASEETHRNAGRLGIGVMTGGSILGWDWVKQNIKAYWEGVENSEPLAKRVVRSAGIGLFVAHIAPTKEQAHREAEGAAHAFVELNIGPGGLYDALAPTSPDYRYMGNIEEIKKRRDDLDYVVQSSPYISFGTPDFMIERLKMLQDMGYTEALLRIDGMGHEVHKRSIDMFGRYVIPEFPDD